MQKEKIAIFALAIIIIGAISAYVIITYYPEEKIIGAGDCADVHYISRYALNDTIIDTSYEDPIEKTGGNPKKVFVNPNWDLSLPSGYQGYSSAYIYGFLDGLIGIKEGEKKTLTLSPEDAYGIWDTESQKELNELYYGVPYFPRLTFWNFTDVTYKDALTLFNEDVDTSSVYVGQIIDYLDGILPSGENTTWQLKIINISGENVTIQHIVENGTIIPVTKYLRPVWNTTIVFNDETSFKERADPKIGDTFSSYNDLYGKYQHVRIMDLNETAIVMGINTEAPSADLVGQTIIYEVEILNIYKTSQQES